MSELRKKPYDERLFSVDVGPALREDDTIDSVTSVDVLDGYGSVASGVTVSSTSHSGNTVAFLCRGGADGEDYVLRLRVAIATTPAQRVETNILLCVRE